MAAKRREANQTSIPGTEPADSGKRKRDPNARLPLGEAVKRLIDVARVTDAEADMAAQIARQRFLDRGREKRAAILARLADDAEREIAEKVVALTLREMRAQRAKAAEGVEPVEAEEKPASEQAFLPGTEG